MEKTRKCKYCNKVFYDIEGRTFANHVRWCPENNDNGDKGRNNIRKSKTREKCSIVKKCPKCEKEFQVDVMLSKEGVIIHYKKEKKFCCKACANSHKNQDFYYSEEFKEKQRNKTKELWQDEGYRSKLENTRKIYFSSKREREIVDYIKNNHPSNEWKSGGCLSYSDEILVRDLWSDELKICFEYDGIWHFKDIHGQLEKKKLKDKLLEEWCIKNRYRLIRVDEDAKLSLEDIEKLIYENNIPIVKIGNRY